MARRQYKSRLWHVDLVGTTHQNRKIQWASKPKWFGGTHRVEQPPVRKPFGAGLSKQPDLLIAPHPFQSLHLFLLAQPKNQVTVLPNTNEILTFYSHLVCKHILKGCSGGGEGISAPSQLLLAGSSGRVPWAPALLRKGAVPGLRGRGEGNSSGVWCLNSPRTADVAALLPVG